jgi:hypothetical protein
MEFGPSTGIKRLSSSLAFDHRERSQRESPQAADVTDSQAEIVEVENKKREKNYLCVRTISIDANGEEGLSSNQTGDGFG